MKTRYWLLVLTGLFVALKYINAIHWSWMWITSPLWLGALLFVLAVFINVAADAKAKAILAEKEKAQPKTKSKWAERLEEMQKMQQERMNANTRNSASFENVSEGIHTLNKK